MASKKKTGKKAAGKKTSKVVSSTQDPEKLAKEKLAKLKNVALEAAETLEGATTAHDEAVEKAKATLRTAKTAYSAAVQPYRDACRKAKAECEFGGARSADVSEQVRFDVKKVKGGVEVTVKGKPKSKELITSAALKASVNKAAYAYTDKHIGPREKVGNKGGSLSNRLRAAIAA